MVVDAEFGYALVEIPKNASGSPRHPDRIEVVKVRLADGSIDSSATVWSKATDQDTNADLTISLDGSHLFVVAHGRRATSISTEDLTVTYNAPANLARASMDHPGLVGQILTRSDEGLTMTSLIDGSQQRFDTTQAPVAAIGQYVYVAHRPKAGEDLEALSILDLSTGRSTPVQGSTLGYETPRHRSQPVPETIAAFFTRDYVVHLKEGEELVVYRLGEGSPLLTRTQAAGASIPASAAAYGGYLYATFGDDDGRLTLIDLASDQEVGATSYSETDIQFVSCFGAIGNTSLAPATMWAPATPDAGSALSDGI